MGAGPEGQEAAAVLGPSTLRGESLTSRQRAIVAALALHRRGGASTDVLVDAVWGEDVPPSARQSLQNQITRLRRRFGQALIETDHAGYLLTWDCDVAEFETLIRGAATRPPSPRDIAPLVRALALWRATPYVDLDGYAPAEAERARLVELHAGAAEQLARCRLVAGDVHEAVVELSALVAGDPYREQRWELLMLALHREGRRAEALDAFDRAAEHLRSGLCVAPSAALQRLRAAVERDEVTDVPDLRGPSTSPCRSRRAVRRPCRTSRRV